MFIQTDTLSKHLSNYGLTDEEIKVYLYVLENGFQSALHISRKLHLGRTKIYRILDDLTKKGLVNHKLGSRGLEFGALSYRQLEFLLIEKEKQLQGMKQSAPILYEQLEKLVPFSYQQSQVLYYSGKEGLEQVTWNSTKAKDKLRIYELSDMNAFMDYRKAELMRKRYVENKIMVHQLTNATSIPESTNIEELVTQLWEVKHIPPLEILIQFEVLIYNDVYAIYSYQGKEVFCVEIYNEQLSSMQKELFDFIWKHAKKMRILNKRGMARI